jgi:hypothetical protein
MQKVLLVAMLSCGLASATFAVAQQSQVAECNSFKKSDCEEKPALPAAPALPDAPASTPSVVAKPTPQVPAPATPPSPPASQTSTPKVGAETGNNLTCKPVKIVRPEAESKTKFQVTLRGANLEVIKSCYLGVADDTPVGVRLFVGYIDGTAVVSLPTSLFKGEASTARCVNDVNGSPIDTRLYRTYWSGGLPDTLDLKLVDKAFYDSKTAMAACLKLTNEQKLSQ